MKTNSALRNGSMLFIMYKFAMNVSSWLWAENFLFQASYFLAFCCVIFLIIFIINLTYSYMIGHNISCFIIILEGLIEFIQWSSDHNKCLSLALGVGVILDLTPSSWL